MSTKKNPSQKVVTAMPPTLMVGLGGTGCEIVGRAYELASESQKKSIQFAFLDTDANELRERKLKAPQAHTVQTSRRITVGQALRDDPWAYENTFPVNPQLMNKPLTEGAGQIRAVSKLAFDMCVREGRLGGLHEAINNLQMLDSDDMEQSIRVLIVSTLVGGTGSGILLPVALYLRNYLENYCNKKPIIRSFCLLPDIFFTDPSKTEIEKSNLRTNAYATLRELDAFMLRADSKPGSDIRSRFTMKMPRPGTVDQYDEYEQNPLDYCFLFDAQNVNGETLPSLKAYKEHAAECIYASSISRLHKRLNSSEDNTILERCAQNGRNRYCGVGVSKLYYPSRQVLDYVALNWMSQAMTEDWLRYDNKVAREHRRAENSRKKGVPQPPIDDRQLYCTYVEQELSGDGGNYFGLSINEETYEIDEEGMITSTARWNSYYKKLAAHIKAASDNKVNTNEITNSLSDIRQNLDDKVIDSFRGDFMDVAQKLKVLFAKTHKKVESTAAVVADTLFSVDNFNPYDETRLEHFLFKNNVPIHPNSARYFLYNLEAVLKKELIALTAPKTSGEGDTVSFPELKKRIQDFFTDKIYPNPADEEGSEVTIIQRANNLKAKPLAKGKFIEDAEDLLSSLDDHAEDIKKYYGMYTNVKIIEKALSFIDDLCKNYELFYKKLADEIKVIDRRIERLEQSFVNRTGSSVINVCASPKCLKALLDDCPNIIDTIQLTPEFKAQVFEAIFKNSSADAGIMNRHQHQIISNIISEDIFNFWKESAMAQYPEKLDMDIVQAIMREAEYEEGYFELDDLITYMDKKHRQALELAAPFIDKPVGQPYQITAYGMSHLIENKNDAFKTELLKTFGNYEKDSLMDRDQILVMIALYNLKAADLKKFASSDLHPADPRVNGSYFRDYVNRIDNVLPDSEKSNIITPHLDRRWHFTGVLPDFEDKTEDMRKTEAQKAFLVALAYGYIRFDRDRYKFVDSMGDYISEQIVVADGLCDKLHEVYEAMSISRPLVRDFTDRFYDETNFEKEEGGLSNYDFRRSRLYKALNTLVLNKYKDVIPHVSFFEIPLLYKTSVGNGSFNNDDAITMLRNFIDVLEEYLSCFYTDTMRRTAYFTEWLDEQTDLFLSNVKNFYTLENKVILQNPFADSLVSRLMNNILGRFNKLAILCDAAKDCHDKYVARWEELTKDL